MDLFENISNKSFACVHTHSTHSHGCIYLPTQRISTNLGGGGGVLHAEDADYLVRWTYKTVKYQRENWTFR